MSQFSNLIKALAGRDRLTQTETALIEGLPYRRRSFPKGSQLVAEHSRPTESCLVITGITAREVFLADGSRQISAMHVPGDFVDLHAFLLRVMDHSVVALTECEAIFVPHVELLRISEQSPHLTRLLWLSTLIDGAIQRAWIASMGRRSPLAHIGHLLCEMYLRLRVTGLVEGDTFEFPISQADLADIMGLSIVHVSRTLKALRKTNFVEWDGGQVRMLDYSRLAKLADFDPTYLNLLQEPR